MQDLLPLPTYLASLPDQVASVSLPYPYEPSQFLSSMPIIWSLKQRSIVAPGRRPPHTLTKIAHSRITKKVSSSQIISPNHAVLGFSALEYGEIEYELALAYLDRFPSPLSANSAPCRLDPGHSIITVVIIVAAQSITTSTANTDTALMMIIMMTTTSMTTCTIQTKHIQYPCEKVETE